MNTYTVTKAMIDATVERGIRDMQEDPHRSMRRLADIGRQFSRGRFQEYSFSIIQELLENENSAYYDMVQNVLRNCDHRTLRVFGVNTSYLSWTYGARRIREFEKENGFCVSCSVMLRFDPAAEDGLSAEDIGQLVREGSELGIYSYYIRQRDTVPGDYQLLSLFEKYRDCAFLWIHETGRVTAAQVQLLRTLNNTILSLPIDDPETMLTAALLREQKIPFATHVVYSGGETAEDNAVFTERILASQAPFHLTIASDQVSDAILAQRTKQSYDSRLNQDYPFFLIDLYGDGMAIGRLAVDHGYLLEIGEDGKIIRPASSAGKLFPLEKGLTAALREVMPAFPPGASR